MSKWLELEFFKNDWPYIKAFLKEERENGKVILPLSNTETGQENLFNAFIFTPRDKVRVVILGQDPYPNREDAMGLAFGVPFGTNCPPSLRNIMKELMDDVGNFQTGSSLKSWAKQGVLLLNTSLTVEEGKPASHAGRWEKLTRQVVEAASRDGPKAWILWGNHARHYKRYIYNIENHFIVESAHPSPLSADRGFFGSRPFSKVNAWLESGGEAPIQW